MIDLSVHEALHFAPIEEADLDDVVALEQRVYPYPWTRGNFADSLKSEYDAWLLRDDEGKLAGYFLLMFAVHEAHLLNVAVAKERQGTGLGVFLLEKVAARARGHMMECVLLEVRPSNERALLVYQRYGFEQIGRRKQYYPAGPGQREDAIIMKLEL